MHSSNRILLALVLGALLGLGCRAVFGTPDPKTTPLLAWIADVVARPVGEIFLRLLLLTVVPLVFTSIALGVAGLGRTEGLRRLGGLTLGYFAVSSALAALLGWGVFAALQPGASLSPELRDELVRTYSERTAELQASGGGLGVDTLVDLIPRNPLAAAVKGQMLAVITVAVLAGIALLTIPRPKAEPTLALLDSIGAVTVRLVELAMKLAPLGVLCLLFDATVRFGWDLLAQLALFAVAVLLGLALQTFVATSLLVRLTTSLPLGRFWRSARIAAVTAFSTSSSSATLPTNLVLATEGLGLPPRITGFVLPLGATIHMTGTAVFLTLTVLFLAAVFGVPLSAGQHATVLGMAVVVAVGAAGVPGGSLPLIMGLLATLGVPPEGLGVILGIDRLLDMARTVPNVVGDLGAAAFVARYAERTDDGGSAER